MSSGAPEASNSDVHKEESAEKPRKKERKDKKTKKRKTNGVPEKDTTKNIEEEDKSDVEESSKEDKRTLKELLTQAAKDKNKLLAYASVRVQNKRNIKEEEVNNDEEQEDEIKEVDNELDGKKEDGNIIKEE